MIRVDSTQLISGKTVVSLYAGHGIQAQNIPSSGTNGAGYLYNDVAAQGAASTDEMRGLILTYPLAGTLQVNEDSSFNFTGAPNGSYSFTYTGFRNGISYGDYTVTLNIGGTQFIGGITKRTLTLSPKTLQVGVGWSNSLSKLPLPVNGKNLTVTIGTSVPFITNIQRQSILLSPKLLTITAGVNNGFSGDILKSTLFVNRYNLSVTAGSVIPFVGDIPLRSYSLNGKNLVLADTEYPILSTERLFFFRTVNKSNYFL